MGLLLLLLLLVVTERVRGPRLNERSSGEAWGDVAADGDVFAVEAPAFGFRAEGADVVAFVGVAGLMMVCGIVAV